MLQVYMVFMSLMAQSAMPVKMAPVTDRARPDESGKVPPRRFTNPMSMQPVQVLETLSQLMRLYRMKRMPLLALSVRVRVQEGLLYSATEKVYSKLFACRIMLSPTVLRITCAFEKLPLSLQVAVMFWERELFIAAVEMVLKPVRSRQTERTSRKKKVLGRHTMQLTLNCWTVEVVKFARRVWEVRVLLVLEMSKMVSTSWVVVIQFAQIYLIPCANTGAVKQLLLYVIVVVCEEKLPEGVSEDNDNTADPLSKMPETEVTKMGEVVLAEVPCSRASKQSSISRRAEHFIIAFIQLNQISWIINHLSRAITRGSVDGKQPQGKRKLGITKYMTGQKHLYLQSEVVGKEVKHRFGFDSLSHTLILLRYERQDIGNKLLNKKLVIIYISANPPGLCNNMLNFVQGYLLPSINVSNSTYRIIVSYNGKSQLCGKGTQIIHLGGKLNFQPSNKENTIHTPIPTPKNNTTPIPSPKDNTAPNPGPKDNAKQFHTPYTITQPIVIRYIDPRIVPLLLELGKLTKIVEHLALNSPSDNSNQNKEQLETLVRSTKQINEKVSVIIQENSASLSSGFYKSASQPEQVISEYQYSLQNKPKLKSSVVVDIQNLNPNEEDIDMVQVLNKVSFRLEELQEENQSLTTKLQNQVEKVSKLQKQKDLLEKQSRQRNNMDKSKTAQLQQQLTSLAINSSIISDRIEKMSMLVKQ